jgi:hypothetical protein
MFSDFFPDNRAVYVIMSKKYAAIKEADNMASARGMLDKQVYMRASTNPLSCNHTDTHTHVRTHINT